MASRFESSFLSFDNVELFLQSWTVEEPLATLVITHGLAEHSDCYNAFAQQMNRHRFNIFAWDLRGHGRSPGKRGYVRAFEDYILDLGELKNHLEQEKEIRGPLYFFGHSMGGLITCRLFQMNACHNTAGLILCAPAMGVALPVPKWKHWLAELSAEHFPKLTLPNGVRYEDLSRDDEVIRSYERDPLRHDKASAGIYFGMLEHSQKAIQEAEKLGPPVCVLVAGKDQLVSVPRIEEFYSQLPLNAEKEIHYFPDSYHEIFNDLDRTQAYAVVKDFISQRSNSFHQG